MKRITQTVAGIMALALTLAIAGCSGGKAEFSTERVCEAFDKYGAEEFEEFTELTRVLNGRSPEAEGGAYYTTKDDEEIELIVENILFRFQDIPDWNIEECTFFIASSKEDGSLCGIYVLNLGYEKDAIDMFDYISEKVSDDDNYTSGSRSGVNYAVGNEETLKQNMDGVYQKGNSILWVQAYADEEKGLKDFESIIKNLGLVSPLK